MGESGYKKNSRKYLLMSFVSVAVFILVWWVCTAVLKLAKPITLPDPITIVKTFITKLNHTAPDGGTLIANTFASVKIALSGYFAAIIIGVPLGILMAWFKPVDRFVRPLFDLLRPVPGIAWIPLMIVIFGIGMTSKVVVIFLTAFVPCVVNSYTGIRQTRDVHLWVGQTFGASNLQLLWTVAIPTALPFIMTGIRVALGSSWCAIVAAELLASSEGLGFMIQQARGINRPDIIICGMLAIGAMGALMTFLLGIVEKRVVKGVMHK